MQKPALYLYSTGAASSLELQATLELGAALPCADSARGGAVVESLARFGGGRAAARKHRVQPRRFLIYPMRTG